MLFGNITGQYLGITLSSIGEIPISKEGVSSITV